MLTGAASMARAVLPAMRANNLGRIVNIGSIHSFVASPFKSAYIAAKHGLIGLSKTLALENTVAEIAALAEYLISDAARNVTAQAIAIDGGWTSQ